MRWAIPASLAIHTGLLVAAWIGMQWTSEDLSSAEAVVSIDIVSMEDAVSEPTEMVSEATASLVSAGTPAEAEPVEAVEPEVEPVKELEPFAVEPDSAAVEPTEAEEIVSAEVMAALSPVEAPLEAPVPQVTDAAAPVVVDTVAPLEADMPEIEPTELALMVEEVVATELETPPMPRPRIVRKPVEKKPGKKPPAKQANAGNGGQDEADSAASKASGSKGNASAGGGGNADAYPSQVFSKLSKAVRRPRGSYKGGEVRIMFTLDASGRVIKTALAQSSGDPKVDDAAQDAVARAKFPAIPEGAGKSTWSFTFPLVIK